MALYWPKEWEKKEPMPNWISNRRLYTTADGSRAVEEGDPDGALLLVGEGCELPEAIARKYGLINDEEQPQAEGGDLGDRKPEGGEGEGGETGQPEGDQKTEGGEGDNPQTGGGKKQEGKARPGNKK
jgi:hypothetical protein